MALNERQQLFVLHYLESFNAAEAARLAGYSAKTARKQGFDLLTKPDIQKHLATKCSQKLQQAEITLETILGELALCAFSDMGNYVTIHEDGQVWLDFSKIPKEGTKPIQRFDQETEEANEKQNRPAIRKTRFALYNKLDALKQLMEYVKLVDPRLLGAGKPAPAKGGPVEAEWTEDQVQAELLAEAIEALIVLPGRNPVEVVAELRGLKVVQLEAGNVV